MTAATRFGRCFLGYLAALAMAVLVSGCIEMRLTVDLQADGSGHETDEIVVVKQQLDQLGPGAAKEVEDKVRSEVQQWVAAFPQTHPGAKPAELNEYVDPVGNRVFAVSYKFANLTEGLDKDWSCALADSAAAPGQRHLQMRCRFSRAAAVRLNRSGATIPYTLHFNMPGRVVSTNGTRNSDNEVEWTFKNGPRASSMLTAEFEQGGFPMRTLAWVVVALVAVFGLVGATFWLLRRRRGAIGVDGRTAHPTANSPIVTCPKCNAGIAAGSKFCRSCGAGLEIASVMQAVETASRCPACGAAIAADSRFCRSCGTRCEVVAGHESRQEVPVVAATQADPMAEASSVGSGAPGDSTPAHIDGPTAPAVSDQTPAATSPVSESRSRLGIPAAAVLGLAAIVLVVAGWFGYAKFASRTEPSTLTAQPFTDQAAPQATAPREFVPPVPMGRDAANGCYVWKPDYLPSDTVKWTGPCSGFLAEGLGTAEWSRDDRPTQTYKGTFQAGFLEGAGQMKSANGESYSGSYAHGRREGRGVLVRGDGSRFEGEFRNDEPLAQISQAPVAAKPPAVETERPTAALPGQKGDTKAMSSRPSHASRSAQAIAAPVAPAPAPEAVPAATIDDQYNVRAARECAAGINGLWCRERLKLSLCQGHWSNSPPAGQTLCKRQEMPKEFSSP